MFQKALFLDTAQWDLREPRPAIAWLLLQTLYVRSWKASGSAEATSRQPLELGLAMPKTGSNRAQKYGKKNVCLRFLNLFNIFLGVLKSFNYSKMAN